ncbi:MAG: dihydroneopterin aldolase [Phaeodactylibacter sp.]|nr:dihydroneopterin aldolase [Phaeodactylibacter sp.]MCB9276468.1 dihydroneopterin aldolase [Lewinellaceae bacterium]
MALIVLEGARFFAYHGYYEEERILGNEFILDIIASVDISQAAETDELYEGEEEDEKKPVTVNYETIFLLCQTEMRKPAKLLEALAERIAGRLEDYFDNLDGLVVRLRKLHPPVGGRADSAWVATARGDLDLSYLSLVNKLAKQ